jgi:peptidoglycan hydrolase-like protein with peptidoglycan-binding domain
MPPKSTRPSPREGNLRLRTRVGTGLLATAATAGALVAAGPATAQAYEPILATGSTGPGVTHLQRALDMHTSRHFDRATDRAVRAFQRHRHLLVDGIVGPQTWHALTGETTAPVSTAAPSTTTSTSSTTGTTSGGYSIPSSIVQCESGGDYSAVNGSSGAGGAYQILPSTWQAYGGQGLPQNAPKAEQDRIASAIYANQGPSAWSC